MKEKAGKMAGEPRMLSGGNKGRGHGFEPERGSVNDGGQSGRMGRRILRQRHRNLRHRNSPARQGQETTPFRTLSKVFAYGIRKAR